VEELGLFTKSFGSFSEKRIAVLGWYGDFNIGNDAILSGIAASFKKIMPNSRLLTFSWQPKLTSEQNDVNALHYFSLFPSITRVDALLVGGGTILTDWQLAFPMFLVLVGAIFWAKMLGKKVVLYAVGAEPFSTKFGRVIAQTIFNRVDLITVRGYRSKNALEMLGLKKPVCVTADPALLLQPKSSGIDKDVHKPEVSHQTKGTRIVVCLRDCKEENGKFKNFIADSLDYCADNFDAEIVLLPISTSSYDDDRKIMVEVLRSMKNQSKVKLIINRLTSQEAMDVIKHSDLVVSMRLHALIFAAAMHTPAIALTGRVNNFVPPSDNKITEFLEMINREAWICGYQETNAIDLLDKIEKKLADARQQEGRVTPNLEDLKARCAHNAKMVEELLK
jgi:polysaccharide pyruvyl transferase CsaB